MTGSRDSSALRSTKRVWGSGPSLASTSRRTPSTIVRPRSTSPPKSAWPGVSMMLIFTSPYRTAVFLARIVMPFSRSRSFESMTRSLTAWFSRNAPVCQSMASTRVVLPWSTWATIATLRRSSRCAREDMGLLLVTWGPPVRGPVRRRGAGAESAILPAVGGDPVLGLGGRGRPGGGRLLGQEHVGPIEAQLLDRLADVVEGPVGLGLVRPVLVDGRIPAPAELLERADVHAAVVDVLVDLGEVAVEEAAVDADRVAAQRRGARAGELLGEVREHGLAGVLEAEGRRLDRGQQPGFRVHLGHEVVHLGELLGRRVDDDVDALVDQLELGVGDQHGDLDDRVPGGVQTRHLQVHPHEPVGHLGARHGPQATDASGHRPQL